MSPALLAPRPVAAVKTAPTYSGQISPFGTATGVITRMPAAADEVKLIVLDSMGEVASESTRSAPEHGMVGLNFSNALIQKAGTEIYFLMVKGYLKGVQVWEQRLGRFSFHQ